MQCLWLCGREADSDEDIVSKWLKPLVSDRKTTKVWQNIPSKHPVENLIPEKVTAGFSLKASRAVCTKCNNTWMSGWEGRVKVPLTSMVKNKTVEVSLSDRLALGSWAAMKCILLTHANRPDPDPIVVDEAARRFFGDKRSAPPSATVIVARIEPVAYSTGVYTGGVCHLKDNRLYVAALSLRSVGFLLVMGSLHQEEQQEFDRRSANLIRLLPSTLELTPGRWPPSRTVSIEELVDIGESPWRSST
jgi:hypothetical protein